MAEEEAEVGLAEHNKLLEAQLHKVREDLDQVIEARKAARGNVLELSAQRNALRKELEGVQKELESSRAQLQKEQADHASTAKLLAKAQQRAGRARLHSAEVGSLRLQLETAYKERAALSDEVRDLTVELEHERAKRALSEVLNPAELIAFASLATHKSVRRQQGVWAVAFTIGHHVYTGSDVDMMTALSIAKGRYETDTEKR